MDLLSSPGCTEQSLAKMLPYYRGGGIVNLMSSTAAALGGRPKYKRLKILPAKMLGGSKNIILLVIDGLGYNYLNKYCKESYMHKHLLGKMTSVFPATTASAITTFATGEAPMQHAMTGWYMHLKELGAVATTLNFKPRGTNHCFDIDPRMVFDQKPFSKKIKAKSYTLTTREIGETHYNRVMSGNAQRVYFKGARDMFRKLKFFTKQGSHKRFIYAYWGDFDSLLHHQGTKSKTALKQFWMLDRKIAGFAKRLEPSTKLIITSDHGFIDTPKVVELEKHPKLKETLTLPLCGDSRAAYCYVHPSKKQQFEDYVKSRLKNCCTLHRSEELIRNGYFGLFKPNPKLFDRVGDYALIAKKGYRITDTLLGEQMSKHLASHSGMTEDEMLVPLIFVCSEIPQNF